MIKLVQSSIMLFASEGFEYGFQTLSDSVEMLYFHSVPYMADYEAGINICDQSLGINFELPCVEMSERDKSFSNFREFKGISV